MRVWVTGGCGFLGRQIVAALARQGAEPVCMTVDLLDPIARHRAVAACGAPVLVHGAWVTRHGAYWDSPDNLDWCAATLDLLRGFAAQGGRRVVLVGSCAEYDWQRPARTPWRETRACRPASLYGAAKLAAWIAGAAFARQAGMSAACARVFIPVGCGEQPGRLLPSLLRAARTGVAVALGPADLTRDLMDVRDAGAAIAALALSGAQGVVNIGSGQGVTLGELARRVRAPVTFGKQAGRPGEPMWMVADITRLRRVTGFIPRHDLTDTIAAAAACLQAAA